MGYTSHKTAGEQTQRQLKKMLPKPDYDYLIMGKPKPKKKSSMRSNTGKTTYRKA